MLGTGLAVNILEAIPRRVTLERHAFEEIRRHPITGMGSEDELAAWQDRGLVEVVTLLRADLHVFEDLTSNSRAKTLDDGEAGTIAYAISQSDATIPVIDERKATRLIHERWPERRVIDTVSLFHALVAVGLVSGAIMSEALYSACKHSRMQVRNEMKTWVVDLIGEKRAAECPSIGYRDASRCTVIS